MRVEILIYPGFDELDAIAPFEVLQQARKRGAAFQTRMVSLAGAGEIRAANGLWVRAEGGLAENGAPGLVIVPGGGWGARSPQGAWAEAQRPETLAAIRQLHSGGVTLAAVCTGAMLFSAAGLLRGRHATTHHVALEELRAQGAEIVEARVVDDGDILTAGGVTSGLDLGLWLVERFAGADTARQVASTLEYERRGPIWQRAARAAAGSDGG
ncbi:MAG TPA: DJ-1/PfpI family protein [Candidatus Acidoferrales bacterium]|nr:DJ-1/PfpI family protein [Candidatus Acidoferrales bacterium]